MLSDSHGCCTPSQHTGATVFVDVHDVPYVSPAVVISGLVNVVAPGNAVLLTTVNMLHFALLSVSLETILYHLLTTCRLEAVQQNAHRRGSLLW